MAKKTEEPEPPKPVLAVEYNGNLYPSMQSAEGARAKADLFPIVCPPREIDICTLGMGHMGVYEDYGRRAALDAVLSEAERVHGILSRYLAAAKAND